MKGTQQNTMRLIYDALADGQWKTAGQIAALIGMKRTPYLQGLLMRMFEDAIIEAARFDDEPRGAIVYTVKYRRTS